MGNWLNDIGVKITFKGTWNAAPGDFPSPANIGDWWIAESSGTMIDITPSPALILSVSAGDHFMKSDTEFTLITSQGQQYIYFEGGVVPSPYTAIPSDIIFVDTTNTALIVKLPTTPNLFDKVEVIAASQTFETNNLTIDPQGELVGGITDLFVVSQNGLSFAMVWLGGLIGWTVFERGDALINKVVDDSGVSYYVDVTDAGGVGHNHVSYLTDAEVRDLVDGTVLSVVKLSSLVSAHQHTLTYTYNNGDFNIVVSANHVGQEHEAIVLGFEGHNPIWILIDDISSPPAPYAALPNDFLIVDTSVQSQTIVLPSSVANNTRVIIIPAGPTYSTKSLYINNNGQKISGVLDSLEVNTDGLALEFIWKDGAYITGSWIVTERGDAIIV